MSSLYLDASAITKLVIAKAETDALDERVVGRSLVSSRVAVVEVTKAVARANHAADAQPVLARIAFVELDAELSRIAATTGGVMLRSLDAIHVASAQRLGTEIEAFVTYHDRQAVAAQVLGLAVQAPGRDRLAG